MMPGPPERFLEVAYQVYSLREISAALGNPQVNSVMKHNSRMVSGTRVIKRRVI